MKKNCSFLFTHLQLHNEAEGVELWQRSYNIYLECVALNSCSSIQGVLFKFEGKNIWNERCVDPILIIGL